MIVARQLIAWNRFNRESVPYRVRSDSYPGLINRPDGSTPIGPNHTVPYGTVPVFARIPGNKLPGYDHSVPPGQNRHTRGDLAIITDGEEGSGINSRAPRPRQKGSSSAPANRCPRH